MLADGGHVWHALWSEGWEGYLWFSQLPKRINTISHLLYRKRKWKWPSGASSSNKPHVTLCFVHQSLALHRGIFWSVCVLQFVSNIVLRLFVWQKQKRNFDIWEWEEHTHKLLYVRKISVSWANINKQTWGFSTATSESRQTRCGHDDSPPKPRSEQFCLRQDSGTTVDYFPA